MKHYHAVRFLDVDHPQPSRRMIVFEAEGRELTLDDVARCERIMKMHLYQSFYIGYGDDSILAKYRGLGLI